MYVELSSNQTAALEYQQCGKCGAKDSMAKEWKNGSLTVKCNACGGTVKRPRGRAVAKAAGRPMQDKQQGQAEQQTTNEPAKPETKEEREAREKAEAEQERQEQEQYEREKQEMLDAMQKMVEKAVKEKPPTLVKVETKEASTGATATNEVTSPHPLLTEVLRRINAGIRNFLFVGPSGSGKTTLSEQISQALFGKPHSITPMSGGLTEGKLIGRVTANGDFLTTALLEAYEQPAVHCLDEFDKSDPNVPACIHSGIENGKLFLPDRIKAPVAIRHPMFVLTATANTWGMGADMMYVGANQIDAAMRSRFAGGIFWVDYDINLETTLVPEQGYREAFWLVRQAIQTHRLRRIWGTRELIRGAMLVRAGYKPTEVFKALSEGFTPDELQKVGI